MIIYLSSALESADLRKNGEEKFKNCIKDSHILSSFAYHKDGFEKYYPLCKSLMLDSGAFTIMQSAIKNGGKKNNFDVMDYCRKYANHIKKYNIENFLELDIEGAYGFEVYKDCLHLLQDITGREPIYVYHRWRGLDYYKELVKKYSYVALGDVDIVNGHSSQVNYIPWFLDEAHKNNCKVHGLAFTNVRNLAIYPFDSVDSSTWSAGVRFAQTCRFDGHQIMKYSHNLPNKLWTQDRSDVLIKDFLEWKKLQKYFDSEFEPFNDGGVKEK